MTYYQKEINRIKGICYSNDRQIQTVIGMRNYIENNFDKELNLDLLSHIRFTSKFHLLRLFKKYYRQQATKAINKLLKTNNGNECLQIGVLLHYPS